MAAAPLPMSAPWKPSVTVAAIVERDGRFLMVEEETPEGVRLNQPAGHLDPGESLVDAAIREALEETACVFTPMALLGRLHGPIGLGLRRPASHLRTVCVHGICGRARVGEETGCWNFADVVDDSG
jgi:8-oxo-dGTP pyrophosphatase MutT (NUDIX family)